MNVFWTVVEYMPTFGGLAVAAFVVLLIGLFAVNKRNGFGVLFGQMYEGMYDFFGDILGAREYTWIKSFITNMFFVILLYNLLGLLFDFVGPVFGYDAVAEQFGLAKYLGFATSDYHFNIAMATVGVLLSLVIQFVAGSGSQAFGKHVSSSKWTTPFLKIFNFIYAYVPFWGKGIITIEKWSVHPIAFYPLWVVIKAFDIVISLFVGFLDIIGVLAKIISLAFRLFWNMLSGTALLTVLIVWLSAATSGWFGIELPLLAPIILVAQGLLVASIQAFVFPLLVAIFIKVARMDDEEPETADAVA